jgi:Fe-S-cluster containining protein
MSKKWWAEASEICMECQNTQCCIECFPPLTEKRIKIIAEKTGKKPEEFVETPDIAGYHRMHCLENGKCVFLNGRRMCGIHQFKPETCVAGPFTFDWKNDKLILYLKTIERCPMVGLMRRDPEAFNDQYDAAVANIKQLLCDMPKNEIDVILQIDDTPGTTLEKTIPFTCNK